MESCFTPNHTKLFDTYADGIGRPEMRAAGSIVSFLPTIIATLHESEAYFHGTMARTYCSYHQTLKHEDMDIRPRGVLYHYTKAVKQLAHNILHKKIDRASILTVLMLIQIDVSNIVFEKE
jgi:hypothetical protein